jgi:hypothetical protein
MIVDQFWIAAWIAFWIEAGSSVPYTVDTAGKQSLNNKNQATTCNNQPFNQTRSINYEDASQYRKPAEQEIDHPQRDNL